MRAIYHVLWRDFVGLFALWREAYHGYSTLPRESTVKP